MAIEAIGGAAANAMTRMAVKANPAAATGAASSAGGSGGLLDSLTIYDPRDTNRDGKVSIPELIAWEEKQGLQASNTKSVAGGSQAQSPAQYDKQGKQTVTTDTAASLIDLRV